MNNENGRSMIETLGVLAIMGIITLASLAGYRVAMRKFRTNAITELMSEISMLGQTQNKCVTFDDMEEAGNMPSCLTNIKASQNGQVKIVFSNESECVELKKIIGTSFGKCKLVQNDNKFLFIPNRGSQCKTEDCSTGYECDSYTEASCLTSL